MSIKTLRPRWGLFLFLLSPPMASAFELGVPSSDKVRSRLYAKSDTWEVSVPMGLALDRELVDTEFLGISLGHYPQESWGWRAEFFQAWNQDREERFCLENFYNDPAKLVSAACPSSQDSKAQAKGRLVDKNGTPLRGANFGPAYIPVREIHRMALLGLRWAPLYGKQMTVFGHVSHFDVHLTGFAGALDSTFFPESLFLRNGRLSRSASLSADEEGGCPESVGICPSDPKVWSLVGAAGRPAGRREILGLVGVGVGQTLHLGRGHQIQADLRGLWGIFGSGGVDSEKWELLETMLIGWGFRW